MKPSPKPGDAVLGCVHRPNPYQAHVFHAPDGIEFMRPDGSHGRATWMMLCDDCRARCLVGGGNPLDVPVGCELTWTKKMGAIHYKEPS